MEQNKKSPLIQIATSVVRPNIWLLPQKSEVDTTEKHIYRFGDSVVAVYGQLYEKDFGTWLCLLSLSKKNKYEKYISDHLLIDIAKEMEVKNPYQKSTIDPLRESFDRLLDAQIRIRPKNGKGFTAKFCLIEGWLKSNDHGSFSISPYREIVENLLLGQTYISKSFYVSLKSTVAKSLYKFLVSHQKLHYGKEYKIRLSKLCKYLNYAISEKPWWKIWSDVLKNALEELEQKKFISRYNYDKTRCKDDGGLITFYPVKKKPKVNTTGEKNNTIVSLIKEQFKDRMTWTDNTENKIKSALNKASNFLEQYSVSMEYFIKDFCDWLKYKDLTFVAPKIFSPDNSFFQEYVNVRKNEGNFKVRSSLSYIDTNNMHEEEDKRTKKQIREDRNDIKNHVCRFHHQFGKDFDKFKDCSKKCSKYVANRCEDYDWCMDDDL